MWLACNWLFCFYFIEKFNFQSFIHKKNHHVNKTFSYIIMSSTMQYNTSLRVAAATLEFYRLLLLLPAAVLDDGDGDNVKG